MPQFKALAKRMRWNQDKTKSERALLKRAMVLQFNDYYGTDPHDIKAWQAMCAVLQILPVPEDLESCRKVCRLMMKSTLSLTLSIPKVVARSNVNIVDYIEAKRLGNTVTVFSTVRQLADYTSRTGKYFPKNDAKAGGVLKYLLRQIG